MKFIDYSFKLFLLMFILAGCNVEEEQPNIAPSDYSELNFEESNGILLENQTEGKHIFLLLSHPAKAKGSIILTMTKEGPQDRPFILSPNIGPQNTIELYVKKGADRVSFKVVPNNDQLAIGHHTIKFDVIATTGPLLAGQSKKHELKLKDDELIGKIKSFETIKGSWKESRTYNINAIGQMTRETRVIENPSTTLSSYEYRYNGSKQLIGISIDFLNPESRRFISYSYTSNRISKAATVVMDLVTAYSDFYYHPDGRLDRENYYENNASGGHVLKKFNLFEYFPDGNIKTFTSYTAEGTYLVVSKKVSFGQYLNKPNPLPFYFDVIPGLNIQQKLPQQMTIEEGGQTTNYNLTYTFDQMNYPLSRTSNGPGGVEITSYQYH